MHISIELFHYNTYFSKTIALINWLIREAITDQLKLPIIVIIIKIISLYTAARELNLASRHSYACMSELQLPDIAIKMTTCSYIDLCIAKITQIYHNIVMFLIWQH